MDQGSFSYQQFHTYSYQILYHVGGTGPSHMTQNFATVGQYCGQQSVSYLILDPWIKLIGFDKSRARRMQFELWHLWHLCIVISAHPLGLLYITNLCLGKCASSNQNKSLCYFMIVVEVTVPQCLEKRSIKYKINAKAEEKEIPRAELTISISFIPLYNSQVFFIIKTPIAYRM